jgi:cytochrome c
MSTSKRIATCIGVAGLLGACATQLSGPPVPAQGPGLGRAASAAEIAAWDISIPPSGAGLPAGSGGVKHGAAVYAAKCQTCHGPGGTGKPADALVGGIGTLATANPVRTVGSYWPYATTLFDFVRRAMPTTAPMSLTDDEVYAVSAYILNLNGIIAADAVMDARTLPQVKMPNREGFVDYSHSRK